MACVIQEVSSERHAMPFQFAFAVANNEKATSLLNWFPKRTLEQCCIDGWNWQKKNPLGYKVD